MARWLLISGALLIAGGIAVIVWHTLSSVERTVVLAPNRYGEMESLPDGAIARLGTMRWLPKSLPSPAGLR